MDWKTLSQEPSQNLIMKHSLSPGDWDLQLDFRIDTDQRLPLSKWECCRHPATLLPFCTMCFGEEIIYFFNWFEDQKEPYPDHQAPPRHHKLGLWCPDWIGLLDCLLRDRQSELNIDTISGILSAAHQTFLILSPQLHGRIIIPCSLLGGWDMWLDLANELWAELSSFTSMLQHLFPSVKPSRGLFHMTQWSALIVMLASFWEPEQLW